MKFRKPILIGKGKRKGIVGIPTKNGYLVNIVTTKRDMESGSPLSLDDISKAEATLIFEDDESLELTIRTLQRLLAKGMRGDDNG